MTHCCQTGGCNTHKVPISTFQLPLANPPLPSLDASSHISYYQDIEICEEDALASALEISRLESRNAPSSSGSQSYASLMFVAVPTAAGASTPTSVSHTPVKPTRPKIGSQLGSAWLAVIDADAADEVEKDRLLLAKAEATSEAKKSVDVMWYDKVSIFAPPQLCTERCTSCCTLRIFLL